MFNCRVYSWAEYLAAVIIHGDLGCTVWSRRGSAHLRVDFFFCLAEEPLSCINHLLESMEIYSKEAI